MDSLVDTMSKRNKSPDSKQCCFCGLSEDNELEFGKIYKHGDIVTHYYCLLLSSNMEQKGTDSEGILGFLAFDIQKELRRGKRLVCTYCKRNGATLGCCNTKCKRIFHYPCGLRAGTLNQFFGEFRSFCKYHRPKQKIDPQVTNELAKTNEVNCYICYDSVNSSDIINTIWAPCCKKNAWFHRKCVQQLAVSAGYFFKCPLCNDKKTFQEAMLEFGIFIPSQDASWELEPNAFHELLHRHDQCDAPICLCPKGRKYTSFNAKWELALCRTCGSQGIHMACGQLKWANPVWDCSECISILSKSTETTNSNTTRSMLQQINTDSEDSDSDISVGKESPPPFISNMSISTSTIHTSTVKQRPGPRTFKIKQQLKAAREMQIMQLSNSCKEGTSIGILDSTHVEESTSTNENAKMKFDVLLEEEITEALSAPSSDNVIMLDSDDDVVEVIDNSSLKNTPVTLNVNETETKNLSQSRNEIPEMNTIRNYNLQTIGKLIHINDTRQSFNNNFLRSNSNVTRSVLSNENSLQNEVISDSLKETIHPNKESEYKCVDIFPDIKITNVISLTPEEFEKVPCTVEEQKENNVECLKSHYSNELLSSTPVFQSLLSPSSCSMSNLKRKFDDTFNSTTTLEDKSKRTRNLNTHELEQQSDSFRSLETANRSITPVNNVSTSTFAKNCVQINNNMYDTSANIPNIKSIDQLHIQVKHTCVTNNHALNKQTSNAECSVVDKCILYDVSDASKYKEEEKNVANEGYTTNCDGDAGTRPAAKSRYQKYANATRIDPTEEFIKLDRILSPSDKSGDSDKWKSQNDTEMATISMHRTPNAMSSNLSHEKRNGKTECNNNRLIPEYIRLRDLKFRVYNPNNLQMTLYDKFSVNINMESATNTKKNMKLDASSRKAVQQKVLKMQSETSSNFRSGNVFHSISSTYNKDKTKYNVFINDQSESFRDDAKENLDPIITIPCKSITDNSVTSTTAVANNLTVSTNSNNHSEDENSTHFVHNTSKIIEEDNWRNRENLVNNINIVNNAENTFDVEERINATPYATVHSNEKHFRNISDMQNIQSLNSDHVTSSIGEKRNVKIGIRNDSFESTKLVHRALYFEDRVNSKTENKTKSMIETCFKISIDLKKIENFIDNNPDLFFIYKKKDDERCFEKLDFLKERTDTTETINISTKHITLPKNKVAELKNQINEDNKKTEDVIGTENLAQEPRYIKNSLRNNQKRDLQRTNNHFEKQCIFNR
ncbi:uncharacterized protein PF3D7_1120600-like isoform X1 [Hylaeus anthracinus]|uniref:uncharacterized protein PF3D7_1120600-like isoform X1 n=2 Tax=Hylaeus anthracinus TaxID=313031 RepID=UPI0023B95721|nr:uncharacterized protein PF3D7_1120600-like isoform X1 [Hylaeus anthracinus]